MGLILLLTAVALLWVGTGAIRKKSLDMPWRSSGGVILLPLHLGSFSRAGVEAHRGAAAVRAGIGVSAFGVMLATWSLSMFWTAAIPHGAGQISFGAGRGLTSPALIIMSLACSITGTIAIFPPWHVGISAAPTALYGEWLLAGVLFGIPGTRYYARRSTVPTVVLAAIVTSPFSTGGGLGIIMGLLLGVAVAVHIVALLPTRQTRTDGNMEQ
jgi:hypothetical protein